MLNDALRLIRVFHDKSQKEWAEESGLSKSYVSELESGKKEPSLATLELYSGNFAVPVSSIMFFSESLSDGGSMAEEFRLVVSKKVIAILDFIAANADANQ